MNTPSQSQRLLFCFGLALAVATLATPRAEACSCAIPLPPTEALGKAAAVFEGSVVSVSDGAGPTIFNSQVQFRVLRAWKGVHADALVTIFTPKGDGAGCGFGSLEVHSIWLVYANEFEGALTTGICARTQRSENAAADLTDLGPATETSKNDGGTSGEASNGGGCALVAARPLRGASVVCGAFAFAFALMGVLSRRRRLSRDRADRTRS